MKGDAIGVVGWDRDHLVRSQMLSLPEREKQEVTAIQKQQSPHSGGLLSVTRQRSLLSHNPCA
jgi:hypothetical protein